MIEIIREGTKRKETCPECGTIFTFEQIDTRVSGADIQTYGLEEAQKYAYIPCPICGYEILLETVPLTEQELQTINNQGENNK